MELAPIILFAYNRPWHVQQTLQSLSENKLAEESELFIYCDGPKENCSEEEKNKITEVRKIIREKKWCKRITIVEAEKNKGLANSIIEGVTTIVSKFSKVIVIEDDVLLSPFFLKFMNDSLYAFRDNPKVLSVGSWNYFCEPKLLNGNFFYRFPDSIAWGTFDRAWKLFIADGREAQRIITEKDLQNNFNANLAQPYFGNMLQLQTEGKINSWAIRWTATAIIHNMLSFFPKQTLSKHIGFGNEATHETGSQDYNAHLILAQQEIDVENCVVEENSIALAEWKKFISKNFTEKKTGKNKIKKVVSKFVPDFLKKAIRKK